MLDEPVTSGRNVRSRGEDARVGDIAVRAGQMFMPMTIGALSCYGVSTVAVVREPRLAILPTGDELRGTDGPQAPTA